MRFLKKVSTLVKIAFSLLGLDEVEAILSVLPIPPVVETSRFNLPPLLDGCRALWLWAVVVFSVNGCAFMFDADSRLTLADFKNDQAEKDMTNKFSRRRICVTPKLAVIVVVIAVVLGSSISWSGVGSRRQKHRLSPICSNKKVHRVRKKRATPTFFDLLARDSKS